MPVKNASKLFKKKLQDLETIVLQMEQGELSLEDSVITFEKGIKLTMECRAILDKAELKINNLIQNTTSSDIKN